MDQRAQLKESLLREDAAFWPSLKATTRATETLTDLLALATLRKRAVARNLPGAKLPTVRVGIVGGYTLHPLADALEQVMFGAGYEAALELGDYDNYVSELLSDGFIDAPPEVLCVIPNERTCRYRGALTDARALVHEEAGRQADELLSMCVTAHTRLGSEIVLANFALPARCDLGAYRSRAAASDWTFRKLVNLELGLQAPPFVHICDVEFLAARRGGLESRDERHWFESKQPGSPDFIFDLSRELSRQIERLRSAPKKVLVLDLDNTLWGGVVGDLGVEGIELGGTSPRGEAFRALQDYAATLRARGILLGICSKNDHATVVEAFEKHPEMGLKLGDFAAIKANWEPKSDNLRAIADELSLGLDSLVFVDDNPAEIEIVRQFTPEVETIWLGDDPSTFVGKIQDSRLFEPRSITAEDLQRSSQYRQETTRKVALASATDMDSYLGSLELVATVAAFRPVDVPRIAQLINKSNQFNLTTVRRSEGDITALLAATEYETFTVRLADRFGDHGLIAVVVVRIDGKTFEIDTWLMSCRVLKRQVEDETLNEIVRLARARGCERIIGRYRPTAKNQMVREHYPSFGFARLTESAEESVFELTTFATRSTHIRIERPHAAG